MACQISNSTHVSVYLCTTIIYLPYLPLIFLISVLLCIHLTVYLCTTTIYLPYLPLLYLVLLCICISVYYYCKPDQSMNKFSAVRFIIINNISINESNLNRSQNSVRNSSLHDGNVKNIFIFVILNFNNDRLVEIYTF